MSNVIDLETEKYARLTGYFKGRLMVMSMDYNIPGVTVTDRKAFDRYLINIINEAEVAVTKQIKEYHE